MKKYNLRKIYNQLIRIFIVTSFIVDWESCVSNQDKEVYQSHPIAVSRLIPVYYTNLFKPEIRNKLKLVVSYEKKGKDTVSNFLLENKFSIQIYTLSTRYDSSLKKSIIESYGENELEVGVIFYDNERSLVHIMDRMVITKKDKPAQIFVSLYGNNPQTIVKNDSIADYYLNLRNLSIKYSASGTQEVYAEASKKYGETIPVELLFIRKHQQLYLLFISPQNGSKLHPKTLFNLLL